MENIDILESLLQVVYLLKGEDGKCDLSEVTTYLYKRGLIYQLADADTSLRSLISEKEEFSSNFIISDEINEEEGRHIAYISLTPEGEKLAFDHNQARYTNPKTLFNWAFIKDFEKQIEDLAGMALPEPWRDGDKPFGILSSYITNTFKRLLHENKEGNKRAIIEEEKWASFNTGLVDKLYDPIYALFTRNKRENMQKWAFHSWCTPGNKRAGQILSRFFEVLPSKAYYFQHPSDLLYDPNASVPTLPFDHIIERLERVPLSFLAKYIPDGFDWNANPEGSKEFYESYRESLSQDDYCQLLLKDAFELSLRRAVKKVAWNYRMVIPVYDAKRRKLMLLIPMSLDAKDNEHIDIALMVERAKVSLKYVGHTILTLGMAYKKARMIMRPESDWLVASQVLEAAEYHSEDDDYINLEREISESEANADVAEKTNKNGDEEGVKNLSSNEDDIEKNGYMYQHENDQIYRPELQLGTPKIVGSIDVSAYAKNGLFGRGSASSPQKINDERIDEDQTPLSVDTPRLPANEEEEGNDYYPEFSFEGADYDLHGVYYENYGKPYIISGGCRFEAREFTDDGLLNEDDVLFDVETEDNKWRPGIFRFAVNIRIADI